MSPLINPLVASDCLSIQQPALCLIVTVRLCKLAHPIGTSCLILVICTINSTVAVFAMLLAAGLIQLYVSRAAVGAMVESAPGKSGQMNYHPVESHPFIYEPNV